MGVTVLGNLKAPMHCTLQMPECQLFIKTWGNMTEIIKAPVATLALPPNPEILLCSHTLELQNQGVS